MSVLLSNIQRFCVHDGAGIRTTVFLKGCSIKCPWCSNPESLLATYDYYVDKTKCIREQNTCKVNPCCNYLVKEGINERDFEKCVVNAVGVYGKAFDTNDILTEVMKDRAFYGATGGVTFSGGEVLLHMDYLEPLLNMLIDKEISLCVETSLFVPLNNVKKALRYFDNFIIDVKILNPVMCQTVINGNLETYMRNLDYLFKRVAGDKITLRMPLVKGITYTTENIMAFSELLHRYMPGSCEIFSVHNLGKSKYESLGLEYKDFDKISDEALETVQRTLSKTGVDIYINKI